jgi:thioesterase domain-containing protein
MAKQLRAAGELVDRLILLDTTVDERYWPKLAWIKAMCAVVQKNLREMRRIPLGDIHLYVRARLRSLSNRIGYRRGSLASSHPVHRRQRLGGMLNYYHRAAA